VGGAGEEQDDRGYHSQDNGEADHRPPVAVVSKGRLATGNLADLIEFAMDLYSGDLATRFGGQASGPVSPALGGRLTTRMRNDRWTRGSPPR
jgi:hypothetical protein